MFYLNKPFTMMALMTMFLSTIMAISSTNWLFLWMSMEINMLSFIPMLSNSKSNQETEATIKYFMAQALGSSIMLMSSMLMWSMSISNFMNIILVASIMLKLGMAPLHFWFPSVMTSISWFSCLILATWQKLAPLIILAFMLIKSSNIMMLMAAILNAIIGGMLGMNQSHIRTIMAYSSITHMGWMTSMLYIHKPMMTIIYFIMYSMIISPIFIMMNNSMQTNNKQFNKLNSLTPMMQMIIPLLLLSLGGMPPLTGFIPKWMTILTICQESQILLISLIIGAMMNMYFYLNILFNSILSSNTTKSIQPMNVFNTKSTLIFASMSLMMTPLIMM